MTTATKERVGHTPGPWWGGWIIRGQTPILGRRENGTVIPGTARVICHIPESLRDDEGEANSRLLKAAPELLAACQMAAANIRDGYPLDASAVLERLLDAIAKATGESESA